MLSRSEADRPASVRLDTPAIAITYRGMGTEPDAILSYSEMLVAALNGTNRVTGSLVVSEPVGQWQVDGATPHRSLPLAVRDFDGVLLQYNPFSYGRWGVAPWLLRDLARIRHSHKSVAIMVHEAYVSPTRRRQRPVRTWQLLQMRALLAQVDAAFAATESLCASLGAISQRIPIHHVPVGSNLPDQRRERAEARRRLGIGDAVVLVAFGTGHPSQLSPWIESAATRAAESTNRRLVLLNLGAGAHALDAVPSQVRVHTPGRLPANELAAWISAGDVFVAPFSDGVSTRRTTVMAALQHSLAVVTTRAHNTDSIFDRAAPALSLAAANDVDAFTARVCELVGDHDARQELGAAGRRFYEEHFSWPVIAGRFTDVLATGGGRSVV